MLSSQAARTLVLLGTVVLALVFGYREALAAMVHQWNISPMYSYGFTVPFVSAYLLWTRRDVLASLTPRPSWVLGVLVLLAGVGMTLAGRSGGIRLLEQVAFLVCLTGAVLILFGVAYLRAAWASLAYLLLMVPLWDGFTESLHEPFQIRSAGIGIWILHGLGIPAFREGTYITLPNLQIEVARVCSGVNYLVAVVALGLPLGYVFLRENWRRAVLLVAAVLVAALSNGLRVALICVLAYYEIGSPLHGPFHVLHGLFVAGIGYVVLFGGLRVLTPRNQPARIAPRPAARAIGSLQISTSAVVGLALTFLLTGSTVVARTPRPVGLVALDAFPLQLGEWTASADRVSAKDGPAALWSGGDLELRRRYSRPDGVSVDLYLTYFASQAQGREMVTHRTGEIHSRARRVDVPADGGLGFRANHVATDKHGVETLFWYDVDGVSETNRYVVKARTLWNAMLKARNNGAVIVLTTDARDGLSRAEALQDFGRRVVPALQSQLRNAGRSGT
jgi:EpsI family protein